MWIVDKSAKAEPMRMFWASRSQIQTCTPGKDPLIWQSLRLLKNGQNQVAHYSITSATRKQCIASRVPTCPVKCELPKHTISESSLAQQWGLLRSVNSGEHSPKLQTHLSTVAARLLIVRGSSITIRLRSATLVGKDAVFHEGTS